MYYAVLLVDIDSLRSTRREECNSSRTPPDPNETSAIARHAPTQYFSDIYSYKYIKKLLKYIIDILLKYIRTVLYTK